ncbi:unnamed protein product [Tilletia laevis]|nr:hypothetical protein CF336_g7032 [Tilletia laevis]KAE8189978.1 hypothetical protein CF335_g6483 [Tilletia laevis]CAD6904371.1 unnamed protein product [Tilletia laevis]
MLLLASYPASAAPAVFSPLRSLGRARLFSSSSAAMFALTPYRGAQGTQPKTFSRQKELPRLPIAPLEQTFSRYLRSLEPILAQKEELGQLGLGATAASELAKRQEHIRAFLASPLAAQLQQRLIDVDRTTPDNWLDDRFWLQKAYHEWRVPLLINSNWWLMFTNDPNAPAGLGEHKGHGTADLAPPKGAAALGESHWDEAQWGIRRAAWMTHRLLEFYRRLQDEDIVPDASRAGPFCMHQYTQLYGITRIPSLPHDWNSQPSGKSRTITVIVRDNYYDLEVLAQDGKTILAPAEIEKALWSIVEDAKRGDGAGVGVLSADARDTWAQNREHLLSLSPVNRTTLNAIEDSLFAIALDSSILPVPSNHPVGTPASASPAYVDALARNCAGAGRGGHNRWFDKAMTLIFEPNGRAGLAGEHSPCDALIPSIVADYASGVPCPPMSEPLPSSSFAGGAWKKLEWVLDAKAQTALVEAEERAGLTCADSDIRELWFDEYGSEWIKKVGGHAPDAYLQMVLQLAHAKVHGYQVVTYETASTRLYKHGRTDVIRSFSKEAYEFVKAVRAGESDNKKLYQLLTAATSSHNQQTKTSSMGGGIDRHLLGLRLVFAASPPAGADIPEVFKDELFAESQGWKLSTSGLSAGDRLAGTGFGAGFPDGYGINYLAGGKLLKFGIESKHHDPNTSTTKFMTAIVDSLREMKAICEGGKPPAAAAAPAAGGASAPAGGAKASLAPATGEKAAL